MNFRLCHFSEESTITGFTTLAYGIWFLFPWHYAFREKCFIKHLLLRIFFIEFPFLTLVCRMLCFVHVLTTSTFKEPLWYFFVLWILYPYKSRLLFKLLKEWFINTKVGFLYGWLSICKLRNARNEIFFVFLLLYYRHFHSYKHLLNHIRVCIFHLHYGTDRCCCLSTVYNLPIRNLYYLRTLFSIPNFNIGCCCWYTIIVGEEHIWLWVARLIAFCLLCRCRFVSNQGVTYSFVACSLKLKECAYILLKDMLVILIVYFC